MLAANIRQENRRRRGSSKIVNRQSSIGNPPSRKDQKRLEASITRWEVLTEEIEQVKAKLV